MLLESIIKDIEHIVRKELKDSAHDLDHTKRVYKTVLKLARGEKVDLAVLKISTLLHDIARPLEFDYIGDKICHAEESAKIVSSILQDYKKYFTKDQISNIIHCIKSHRYRNNKIPTTIEAKILYDADKLDAIGAIGIARAFMISGKYNQKLNKEESLEDYKKKNVGENGKLIDISEHTTPLEYLLKLRYIKDKMLTEKGKSIALKRHKFTELYFKELIDELKVKK